MPARTRIKRVPNAAAVKRVPIHGQKSAPMEHADVGANPTVRARKGDKVVHVRCGKSQTHGLAVPKIGV